MTRVTALFWKHPQQTTKLLAILSVCILGSATLGAQAAINITWDDDVVELPTIEKDNALQGALSDSSLQVRQFSWNEKTYRREILNRGQNLVFGQQLKTQVSQPIILKADFEIKSADILFYQWEIKNLKAESQLDESSQVIRSDLLKTEFSKPGLYQVSLLIQDASGKSVTRNWELEVSPNNKLLNAGAKFQPRSVASMSGIQG